MADTREQIYAFIEQNITDPYLRQNTAEVVRMVLKYMVQNAANLADDDLGYDPNVPPVGASWALQPTIKISDDGTEVEVSNGASYFVSGSKNYLPDTFPVIPLENETLTRLDAVYAHEDETFGYKIGDEGQTAPTPVIPAGTLLVGYLLYSSEGIVVTDPATGLKFTPYPLVDAATINVDGSQSLNFNINAPTLLNTLAYSDTQPGHWYTIDVRQNATERTVTIAPQTGVSYVGLGENTSANTITLPVGDSVITYYHRSNTERRVVVLDGKGNPATGEASASNAGSLLEFTNPFGDVSDGVALSGNKTFTRTGAVLGATVIRKYTADGTSTITFDFTHYLLNADFTSGSALEAGEYELYFSNRGSTVAIAIAAAAAIVSPGQNTLPTANAGADQAITLPTNSVTLSGSGTDADGTISAYAWSKVSGPAATITSPDSATTTLTGLVEGSYTFRLTVTDNNGATATDEVNVVVYAQGVVPLNVPGNFTATAQGQNQINITWTDTNS